MCRRSVDWCCRLLCFSFPLLCSPFNSSHNFLWAFSNLWCDVMTSTKIRDYDPLKSCLFSSVLHSPWCKFHHQQDQLQGLCMCSPSASPSCVPDRIHCTNVSNRAVHLINDQRIWKQQWKILSLKQHKDDNQEKVPQISRSTHASHLSIQAHGQ